jgi:hypothetical protein
MAHKHRADSGLVNMNRVSASMVLENSVIFGTVSAARRHLTR